MPDPKPGATSRGGSSGSDGGAYVIDTGGDEGVSARFAFLTDPEALRRRFVLSEILGTPRALQLRRGPAPARGRR